MSRPWHASLYSSPCFAAAWCPGLSWERSPDRLKDTALAPLRSQHPSYRLRLAALSAEIESADARLVRMHVYVA